MGSKVRELRNERGVTIGALAECTRINSAIISLVERGKRVMRENEARKIARFFGISTVELSNEYENLKEVA